MIELLVTPMDMVSSITIELKTQRKVETSVRRYQNSLCLTLDLAIDTLNQFKMEHKTIKVSYARPKCEETRGTNLYIRNLPGKRIDRLWCRLRLIVRKIRWEQADWTVLSLRRNYSSTCHSWSVDGKSAWHCLRHHGNSFSSSTRR